MLLKSKDFRDSNQPGSYEQPLSEVNKNKNIVTMMYAIFKNFIELKSFYTSYEISIMVLQADNMTSANLSLIVQLD